LTQTAALVVAWRQVDLTLQALQSIAAMDNAPSHIVCIAQQFTPDEQSLLFAGVPVGVDVVVLDQNIGFAAASNLGVTRASTAGAEWVLLLNNDATVAPSCLNECLSAATSSDIAAIAPAVVCTDQPDRIWWAGGQLSSRWGITRHPRIGDGVAHLPPSGDTEFIPGCCVLYSVEAWKRIGGFSEEFFMYYEDAEWCLRARQEGWRLRYIARPLCRHAVGVSSGQRDQSRLGVNSAYFLARNQLRAALNTASLPTRITRLLAVLTVWNAYNLLRALRSRDRSAVVWSYARGVLDGCRKRMGPQGHFRQVPG